MQTAKSLAIVKFTGDNSFNAIFINGNAKAQKIIGNPIINKKYFSEKILWVLDLNNFFSTTIIIPLLVVLNEDFKYITFTIEY